MKLSARLNGRYMAHAVVGENGKVCVKAGELVTDEVGAKLLADLGASLALAIKQARAAAKVS